MDDGGSILMSTPRSGLHYDGNPKNMGSLVVYFFVGFGQQLALCPQSEC
jgi:hypothetical protein